MDDILGCIANCNIWLSEIHSHLFRLQNLAHFRYIKNKELQSLCIRGRERRQKTASNEVKDKALIMRKT